MKKIIAICFLLTVAGNCFGQQVTFQKAYGGSNWEDYGECVQQTTDGGYIIAGHTRNFTPGNPMYLIKTNAYGDTLWTKTVNDGHPSQAYSVQQTSDGGYIIAGSQQSIATLVKLDSVGNLFWTKIYDTAYGVLYSVQQTSDGGYIMTGYTSHFAPASYSVYLIKTDSMGNSQWQKALSGTKENEGYSVQQTSDGGYIIAGQRQWLGASSFNAYLVKTDANGNPVWAKTYGGFLENYGYSVQQTIDGGYIMAGHTMGFGLGWDVYVVRTDSLGDTLWTRAYGTIAHDYAYCIQQTTDGGFVITGYTGGISSSNADVYLIKTDGNGDLLWSKAYGGTNSDFGNFVRQTSDGGYIITGYSYSFGPGHCDVYLIKTDSSGNSGCNQGNPSTVVSGTATQVTSYSITGNPGGSFAAITFITGNGGIVESVCPTVGINPTPALPGGGGVTITPNPATNNFTITFPNTINKGVIEIYNVMGEKIFKEDVFNVSQKEVQLKNMEAGIYFVKVTCPDEIGRDGEKEYCKKLVIE